MRAFRATYSLSLALSLSLSFSLSLSRKRVRGAAAPLGSCMLQRAGGRGEGVSLLEFLHLLDANPAEPSEDVTPERKVVSELRRGQHL